LFYFVCVVSCFFALLLFVFLFVLLFVLFYCLPLFSIVFHCFFWVAFEFLVFVFQLARRFSCVQVDFFSSFDILLRRPSLASCKKQKKGNFIRRPSHPLHKSNMSAAAFFSLRDESSASTLAGNLVDGSNIASVRALESRKTGSGPTSAIGVSSGAAVYADQLRVTAADGLIMPPLFVAADSSATAATNLQVNKSDATYFIQAGNYSGDQQVNLRLPALSLTDSGNPALAGFKARFVIAGAISAGAVQVMRASTDNCTVKGFISHANAMTVATGVTTLTAGSSPFAVAGNAAGAVGVANTMFNAAAPGIAFSSTSEIGDWVEFETDGLNWFVRGVVKTKGSITTAS
jgi:hypothetical protein